MILTDRRTSPLGLGCAKTKSDFGRSAEQKTNFSVFFALRITTEPKIPGANWAGQAAGPAMSAMPR
jgi:hypothetical protein